MNIENITPSNDLEPSTFIQEKDDAGANKYNSYQTNLELDKTVAESDILEKGASFLMSYGEMNGAVNIFDWAEHDSFAKINDLFGTEDKEFTSTWDETSIMTYMQDNDFGMKEYPRLSKANSPASLAAITKGINQDLDYAEYKKNHLSQGWQTAGSILGTILDADVLIPTGKVVKAVKVMDDAKALRAVPVGQTKELAIYSAWESSHAMVNDDYTAADAVLGVAAASMISVGLTKYQMSKVNKSTIEYSNTHAKGESDIPVAKGDEPSGGLFNQEPTTKTNTPSDITENYMQKYKWTEQPTAAKVGDNIEPTVYIDNSDGKIFNKQMSDMLKEIMVTPKKDIDSLIEEVVNVTKNARIDKIEPNASKITSEMNELMGAIKKESGFVFDELDNVVQIKFNKNKDGSYSLKTPNGNKFGKAVPATLAVALAGTAANAGEDDIAFSTIGAAIMTIGIVGIAGTASYKAWARSGGRLSTTIKRAKASIAKSQQSVDVATKNPLVKNIRESGQVLRTRLTETYQRFADEGGIAKEMADKLLVNFANGTVQSAEIMKRRFSRIAEANVAKVENAQFVHWLEAQGLKHRPVLNFVENNLELDRFRNEITDAIDGGVGGAVISPQAQKVADEFKTQMKGLYDELVAADVKGYRETVLADGTVIPAIKYTEDYIPRYWKSSNIRHMISANDDNRKAIHASLTEMSHSAAMKRYQKKIEEWNKTGRQTKEPVEPTLKQSEVNATTILKSKEGEVVGKKGRVNDNSIARLEKQMEDQGIEMTPELRKTLEMESDKTARAMHKVDLDYKAFKPFKAIVDGKEIDVDLGMLIDRDSHSVMSRYANEQGGNIALGKAGYPTVKNARTESSKIADLELREDMNMVIDSIAGEDLVGMTQRQKQRYEVMTGIAFVAKLPLVTVSMLTEYAKVLTTKSGFHSLMNQITEGITGNYPKHSMFMDEIINATGQGTASLRHEVNLKGLDDISNIAEATESAFTGTTGTIANTVRQGKEAASRYYGLLRFSDFLQKHAGATNAQVLGEMIHKGRKMSPYRMQQYGITEEMLADFKSSGLLDVGSDGWVTKLDYEKFTQAQKDSFNNTIFRMNQNLTQETSLGGTALYMHNDYMFKSLSYLLTFPAEAFANHGIRDLTTMDNEAFRSMFAMYLGGYMSLKLRYAVENKDVSDEEVAYRAMIGMPIFGAVGTATGITDPVVLSFFNNMSEMVKLSNYEDVVVGE